MFKDSVFLFTCIFFFNGDFWGTFWEGIRTASVRFHIPTSGLGNSPIALAHVKTMRMLTTKLTFLNINRPIIYWKRGKRMKPIAFAKDQKEYVIWFTGKGEVKLNVFFGKYRVVKNEKNQNFLYDLSTLDVPKRKYEIKWLNVLSSKWTESQVMEMPGLLKAPTDEQWAVLIRSVN